MATLSSISSPCVNPLTVSLPNHHKTLSSSSYTKRRIYKSMTLRAQAAKLPTGVITPKVEPKFTPPFLGFTNTAETWNSRACMIGLIGTFIVELILNKGILQIIGVEVGKGLDLPL
ncbi:Light-harvesting complex-like protein ohp1 protein [Thalictrum thalictroides]|uniref:Light-harvesting complex-like protein ohp1 protein n=1 Tax=Thalictrum thalictroides TaxID=46969 RepID=A0A7J6UVM5_THATH|nr:Light-harvesting complex-like protein ohp1 protein [Thalictrum thalictroides]